jgi:hypothetical protein
MTVLSEKMAAANKRPEMRPESPVADDPRIAAKLRAEQIRKHIGNLDEGPDEFRAPPAPPGWEYEWKSRKVMNQENHSYMTELFRTGWVNVPTSRHPEMMPSEGKETIIERKGMVLMERPKEINDEVRNIELKKARSQVYRKEAQLAGTPEGQMDRTLSKVNKNYQPMPIPNE